jgi:hypothetical protein
LHDEIVEVITMTWNDLTFDEVKSVFHNWMNRLRWVIENGGSTLLNKDGLIYLCLLSDGIGGGSGDFLCPLQVSDLDTGLNGKMPFLYRIFIDKTCISIYPGFHMIDNNGRQSRSKTQIFCDVNQFIWLFFVSLTSRIIFAHGEVIESFEIWIDLLDSGLLNIESLLMTFRRWKPHNQITT